jgi:ProP effector
MTEQDIHSEDQAPAAPTTPAAAVAPVAQAASPAPDRHDAPVTSDTPETSDAASPPTGPEAQDPGREGRRNGSRRHQRKPGTGRADGPRNGAGNPPAGPQAPAAPPRVHHPLLEQLAGWYPHLFGANFLPLKRGIFEDIMQAHPEGVERDALKAALAQHTRSSRYLTAMAAGTPRHDLQGHPVEPLAPEHVYHALQEVFRRRQRRTPAPPDLQAKLVGRIQQAFEASGLAPEAYAALVRGRDESANAALDAALAQAFERAAKDEALLRAFTASGQTDEAAFADMYGMDLRTVRAALQRARRQAPQASTVASPDAPAEATPVASLGAAAEATPAGATEPAPGVAPHTPPASPTA